MHRSSLRRSRSRQGWTDAATVIPDVAERSTVVVDIPHLSGKLVDDFRVPAEDIRPSVTAIFAFSSRKVL